MGPKTKRLTAKGIIAAVAASVMAGSALAEPKVIHAGRLIAVPGEDVRGPSTITPEIRVPTRGQALYVFALPD